MRPWSHGKAPLATVAAAAVLLATACSDRGGAPEPATRQGEDVLDLWRILLGAGVALGALVTALILWSVVRYRRPRDAQPGDLPNQTRENVPVEVMYTVVPLVIVVVLFALTMRTQDRVTRHSATTDLAVEVTGFQWGWRFRYPVQGVTVVGDANDIPTLVLPVGASVRLRLEATDVIHSFFVPAFLVKRDLIPGVDNSIEVQPTEPGRFPGVCAEFCGLDHWRMSFDVEVVSPAEFQRFVAEQQQRPAGRGPDDTGPGDVGRQASLVR
ncbi:MAG TPA: cytochrome c oxidase subunit II [Acidimicrobiales bacterium]|nr:cytochrome c oxidase subunit II [Acidimicrobiales bacterium]